MLHQEGLLTGQHGCELTIVMEEGGDLWVGRTVAAQDIDAYSKRDMEKPVRDTTVGLLPPKLAQTLLNFGAYMAGSIPEKKKDKLTIIDSPLSVLDPFCGTGVIPMECLLLGWPVQASDSSLKAVTGCTKNLEWIRKEMKIAKKDVPSNVWKQDATKPFSLKDKPQVIVSETTLGTPLASRPTLKDVSSLRSENEKIQAAFLHNVAATLPGVPVVCTWPVWYSSKTPVFLEKIWKAAHDAGFEPVLPPGITPTTEGRLSLLYRRPDQFVGREIVLLKPKKK